MSDVFADAVVAARRGGGLVAAVPPLTLDEGYRVARRVWPRLGTGAGWKVGATSAGAQAFLRVDTPIRGRIVTGGVVRPGDVAIPGDRVAEAEPEIVFRFGRDIAAGEDPIRAVDAVHIGLEIVRPSRDDAFALGAGFIVADNAAHVAVVVGAAIDPALLDTPTAIAVRLRLNDAEVAQGDASAVLGDPRDALRWLAGETALCAGDWVASGAIVRACRFAPGDSVVADFGPLGRVEARRS